jgi:ribosomal protein L7/L12
MSKLRVRIPDKHRPQLEEIQRLRQESPEFGPEVCPLGDIALEAMIIGLRQLKPDRRKVVLLNHGPKKIDCIKVIRQHTGYGLKEAKAASENHPWHYECDSTDAAKAFLDDLLEKGAAAELR